MKLSIITINLNNAPGFKLTIESVLSQTWQDFEFIIVDGGSTDESMNFINSRLNNINKNKILTHAETKVGKQLINWVSEPDNGIFNAMNKGIKIAKGEYLLFLNSGDFLFSKTVLKEIFDHNVESTTDFICAKCAVSQNGSIVFVTEPPKEFTFINFYNTTLAHQSTFIKKRLFEKYGYYKEDFKLKGDWEFFIRTIILNKCTTRNVDVILTDYNMEGVSALHSNTSLKLKEVETIYNETLLSKFVPDYKYYSTTIEEMEMYFWVKENKILNMANRIIYVLAKKYNQFMRKNN